LRERDELRIREFFFDRGKSEIVIGMKVRDSGGNGGSGDAKRD
jgi:hypothetical protein